MKISLELDPDVNALYVRFDAGEVARSLQIEETVLLDIDANGGPVGLEFTDADDFLPFLRRHAGRVDIPDVLNGASGQGIFAAAD